MASRPHDRTANPTYDLISNALDSLPQIQVGILFGSLAHGHGQLHSDIDLAVAAQDNRGIDIQARTEIIETLSVACRRPVDLVDLATARGELLRQIVTNGVLVFCRNTQAYAEVIRTLCYDQADFEPLRQQMLQAKRNQWIGA